MHLGSLFTALASFLHARSQDGKWLLRIDDIDSLRNVAGATDSILKTLDAFGLHWDDSVYYQSQALEQYQHILHELEQRQLLYRCICTRKHLKTIAGKGQPGVYPGFCRAQTISATQDHAIRLKTDHSTIRFEDQLQGIISENIATEHGDFIIKRKDRIIAYQLAVVVDDYQQKINHIVRGSDLLDSTAKHLYLQKLLAYPQPEYMHLPVIIGEDGYKLSKQTFAQAVGTSNPAQIIYQLLQLLRQDPPKSLYNAPVEELLSWAISHWTPDQLKNIRAIQ